MVESTTKSEKRRYPTVGALQMHVMVLYETCCHGRCRAPEATSVREIENFTVVMLEKREEETTKRRRKEKKNLCFACFCFNP